jgi:hypothetical protein
MSFTKFEQIYKEYLLIGICTISLLIVGINIQTSNSQEEIPVTETEDNATSTINNVPSKNSIQIGKSSTASYNIVEDSTGLISTFDNLYTITGKSDSLGKSKNLIISMVRDDLLSSPTNGYVRSESITNKVSLSNQTDTSISLSPNPFVDLQTINATLTQQLSKAIDSAQSLGFTMVAINCDFGMNIKDWKCEDQGIFE